MTAAGSARTAEAAAGSARPGAAAGGSARTGGTAAKSARPGADVRTSLVVAADFADVIGRGGDLPWHLPGDLRRFKALTAGGVVVAGRRTHESIVARLGRPLPGRLTVVVSRRADLPRQDGMLVQPDVPAALHAARAVAAFAGRDELFVIGGAEIYAQALPEVTRIHLTRVHARVGGDTALPAGWLAGFTRVAAERVDGDALPFTVETYERA
ncbi:dihydrofolate reductase [Plantactinospora siamensis]|uniref:dihydrofolate reductase n=1 Tax=Plantactinospora siamensis TaxID=555372 RepID=A0ABV6NQ91_9ACTN